ncbi:hypothetical protein P775_04600 [Puniceibacterium antarcticum]|uniref:Uncharacterized protein n=1 Tax=Puniceibacterium antarcticum TaxID=1206336 RepID=A0A2G8RIN1_9RHOB|nr:hypothetical protein [Puniceibacterium antarcticum]PIL21444.1 hypothetical protein P775_04600 [Puniceibacterium antarcticum]
MSMNAPQDRTALAPVRGILRPAPVRRYIARPDLFPAAMPQPGSPHSLAWLQAALTLTLTALVATGFAVEIEDWSAVSGVTFGLITLTTASLSLGATTALIGLMAPHRCRFAQCPVRSPPGVQPCC